MASNSSEITAILSELLSSVKSLQQEHVSLKSDVKTLVDNINPSMDTTQTRNRTSFLPTGLDGSTSSLDTAILSTTPPATETVKTTGSPSIAPSSPKLSSDRRPSISSKVTLTTYPRQSGVDPIPLNWGCPEPQQRGPVVVSRNQTTIRRRNAIGAHGGSYAIYHALGVASKNVDLDHVPDFTNAEPAVNLGPFPAWGDPKKLVSLDPFGHLAPWLFKSIIASEHVEIRPTIAITKAHMKLPELENKGRLVPDGKIVLNESGELAVTKIAIEPVWHLPGVAERFGIDEGTLRRSLFEHTGGAYPELITRGDVKVFLPPIGGLTVYCFGDPAKMSNPSVSLALRVHDECNGSDVFGSDICTCRPYLIFGIEEAVKEAQNGGSGVVIYFRKEGRALGEVIKYLVYNARKRGADLASEYFNRTLQIAGVKDSRFQALMPDVLHWLGIQKIDRFLSMSNMKHDAIVEQGIPIIERVPIPDDLIPEDSRVEIDAKIHSGYFTTGAVMTLEELAKVKGRPWEDVNH